MRILRFLLILSVLIVSTAIGGDKPKAPNTDGIAALYGRFAHGHACPVAADALLTGAHVADIFPTVPEFPYVPYRFQNVYDAGRMVPVNVSVAEDIAVYRPLEPLHFWYEIASAAPQPGEHVWFVGYSWRDTKRAFERVVIDAEVTRVIAGALIYKPSGENGSSGSCVLNSAGLVVAINEGAVFLDNRTTVGVAVGVWGAWAPTWKRD